MKKEQFPIQGMHCASCKRVIETTLKGTDGVHKADVNFATEKLAISYDENILSRDDIAKRVQDAGGYTLVVDQEKPEGHESMNMDHKHEAVVVLKKRIQLVAIAIFPFIIMMGYMLLQMLGVVSGMEMSFGEILYNGKTYSAFFIFQWILATWIMGIGGRQFFTVAFQSAKKGNANMDTLVALGTGTAYVYSTIVTFFPSVVSQSSQEVYFEAAAFIVFFILIGRYLEAKAKHRASDAIESLISLQPNQATVIRGGKEVVISITDVVVGDVIVVKPGSAIPVDGRVIEGVSYVNEAMITGESLPVEKKKGSTVIGGTLNTSGTFEYIAEKIGKDTMLAQIIALVEDAQNSSAPIQKLADKISGIFVPIVLVIALLAWAFWYLLGPQLGLVSSADALSFSLYIATAVLIIACPCALGLATPTAVIVGTGKAAKKGILIKNAESLEIASKISVILFDKTGTLTVGAPSVQEVFPRKIDEDVLTDIASLESRSEHPLSNAIVSFANKKRKSESYKKLSEFKVLEGKGIQGTIGKKEYIIGNERLFKEKNISTEFVNEFSKIQKKAGNTVVYVAKDNECYAALSIADSVKPEAKSLISELIGKGITPVMVTGDNKETAASIAKQVGITEVVAEVLPKGKVDLVKKWKEKGLVAMVGDGINDAPALAEADIAIAMGTGTDVAIHSADIVLVHGNLEKVIDSLQVSKDTLRIIRQNLAWAFGYNILAIPIAAGVLFSTFGFTLSPIIASAAMAGSSISVVLNSLRLHRKKV